MARYAKDHHEKSHDAIVLAASNQLREHGFEGVSIAEVMKAAGLTHGGFYAHFKDRNRLIQEAMDIAFKDSEANFQFLCLKAKGQCDNGLIADHYLSDKRVIDVASGCPVVALSADRSRMPEDVRRSFDQGIDLTRQVLRAHFGSEAKADVAMAMLFGTMVMMRTTEDVERRSALRRNARQFLAMI